MESQTTKIESQKPKISIWLPSKKEFPYEYDSLKQASDNPNIMSLLEKIAKDNELSKIDLVTHKQADIDYGIDGVSIDILYESIENRKTFNGLPLINSIKSILKINELLESGVEISLIPRNIRNRKDKEAYLKECVDSSKSFCEINSHHIQ